MKPATKKRIYEIIPGSIVWGVFISAIVLSFVRPLWVIYFVIAYDLLWLFRVAHFTVLLNFAWKTYKKEHSIEWMEEVKKIKDWQRVYHYVVLPTAGEPFEVLDASIASIAKNHYSLDKFVVHVAGEERFKESFDDNVKRLKAKYKNTFFQLFFTTHPDNLPNEMKGKGANAHYAGHQAKKLFDDLGIAYEDIMCSYFDSDTIVHPQYFANLTHKFLTVENPLRKAYQPAVVYNNNIWEAPSFTRITAFGTVFWLMAELVRPERMYTFSSHSMPFKALVDVNFWQKDIVTDDSRIFLQGFFRYHGDFEVVPMYIPVSMEAVHAKTQWQAAKNLYKQQRRWAWGVEHFPYMMQKFKEVKGIPKWTKFKYMWNMIEGMFSWATAPILIFVLGRLPLFVAGYKPDSASVIIQNSPFVLEWIMGLAMLGIVISAIFGLRLLPPRPKSHPRHSWIVMLLQWIMLPVTIVIFGAIPAIDAQTRLMLGGKFRLGFWVTPKDKN